MPKLMFTVEKKPASITEGGHGKYDFILETFKNLRADETIKFPYEDHEEKKYKGMRMTIVQLLKRRGLKAGGSVQNGFLYIYKKS